MLARRSVGIRRWLGDCRNDLTCCVQDATKHIQAQAGTPPRRRSEGACREFRRESGDLDPEDANADAAEATYQLAADDADDEPSLAEELLNR